LVAWLWAQQQTQAVTLNPAPYAPHYHRQHSIRTLVHDKLVASQHLRVQQFKTTRRLCPCMEGLRQQD